MDIKIVIGIIGLFLGLVYFLIPKIYNYYFKRPKLIIEIDPNKGITHTQSFVRQSSKNDPNIPVNSQGNMSVFKLEWFFDMVIRNNSEVNAFNIKLYQRKGRNFLDFKKEINPNKALKAHFEEIVPFVFTNYVEIEPSERNKYSTQKPPEFKDLMLQLEYENQYGRVFYSRYYFNTDKSDLKRVKKDEMNNWI